jgi:hypothetical protein
LLICKRTGRICKGAGELSASPVVVGVQSHRPLTSFSHRLRECGEVVGLFRGSCLVDTCFLVELVGGRRKCGDALVLALHALFTDPVITLPNGGVSNRLTVNDLKYLSNDLRQRTCYHHGKPFSFSPPKN